MAQDLPGRIERHFVDEVDTLRAPIAGKIVLTMSDDCLGFCIVAVARHRRDYNLAPSLVGQPKDHRVAHAGHPGA